MASTVCKVFKIIKLPFKILIVPVDLWCSYLTS